MARGLIPPMAMAASNWSSFTAMSKAVCLMSLVIDLSA